MNLRSLAVFVVSLLVVHGCRDDFNNADGDSTDASTDTGDGDGDGDGECAGAFCMGEFQFRANSSGWSHVADIDGDGRDDVVNDANMFWGVEAGLPDIEVWPYLATELHVVAGGDIDGQPGIDAALIDADTDTVHIYLNDGGGTLEDAGISFSADGVDQVTLTELLGASDCPDLVGAQWTGLKRHDLRIWIDVCSNPVGVPEQVTIPNTTLVMLNHAVDIDDDGRDDFMRDTDTGMSMTAMLTTGNTPGNWSTQVSPHADGQRFLGAVADVLGSSSADAILRDRKDLRLIVRPGNGDGTFGDDVALPKLSCPWWVEAADMDADDDVDLIVVDGTAGACVTPSDRDIAVLLNDGNGGFTLGATVQVDSDGLGHILPGDFNGDGRMDIVTGGPNSELGIVYGVP